MVIENKQAHIAYRCPDCGTLIYGFVGQFALASDLLRLRCECGGSALDIKITNDKKVRLSVPCLYCKQNHNYVVSQSILFGRELFILNCPYSNMDIAFIGDSEKICARAEENAREIENLLKNLELESVKDMQPEDVDDEEGLPDPATYDILRFLVKDLEADGKISCKCDAGEYELCFADGGIQVYCKNCGATHTFKADSPATAEAFLDTDSVELR